MTLNKGFKHKNGKLVYNLSYWSKKVDKELEGVGATYTDGLKRLFTIKGREYIENYQELHDMIINKIKNFVNTIEIDANNKNKYIIVTEKRFGNLPGYERVDILLIYDALISKERIKKSQLDSSSNEKFIVENEKLIDYSGYWN